MKKTEQPRGLLFQLQEVSWSWFGTFTFGLRKRPDASAPGRFLVSTCRPPSRSARYSMFYQWLRSHLEKTSGERQTVFMLRHELGEMGSRPHFHFLMVVPDQINTISHRFRMMSAWENLGGGFARVRPVKNTLRLAKLLDYTTKHVPIMGGFGSAGADKYESNKFEQSEWEDLKLSPALLAFLADR